MKTDICPQNFLLPLPNIRMITQYIAYTKKVTITVGVYEFYSFFFIFIDPCSIQTL